VEGDHRQNLELAQAEAWLVSEGLSDLAEVKPGAIALHWRGLDPAVMNEARTAAYRVWWPIADRAGLKLEEFDGGLELRLAARNKGDAVRTILREMGEPSVAAYLGDDRSDEDAFRALRETDLGVLVRTECRNTSADLWVKPPDELLQFLIDWANACGGELC
jgi:trehalose-phosphatase